MDRGELMGYIWEQYSPDNRYRIETEGISPYTEVWGNESGQIAVNVLYRFEEIFFPKKQMKDETAFRKQMELYEANPKYEEFANLLFHYLAQLERKTGMGKLECLIEQSYIEIMEGRYGEKFREKFVGIDKRRQFILLKNLAIYDEKNQRETMIGSALQETFGWVQLYYENTTGMIHIYINQGETEENKLIYEAICYLFQDIGTKMEVMWRGQHFGIIGMEEVMKIDGIGIY